MGSKETESVFNNIGEIIVIMIALVFASVLVGGIATAIVGYARNKIREARQHRARQLPSVVPSPYTQQTFDGAGRDFEMNTDIESQYPCDIQRPKPAP